MDIRVYYEDTDCGNVVYYANYLKFMERSRTEYMRGLGIDFATFQTLGFTFVVIDAHIKYRSPARYNDLLRVESEVTELTSATIVFTTEICKGPHLLVKGEVKVACITPNGHAGKIPAEIRNVLEKKI
jgi:acyl-CoA thioester hydrolase